MHRLPINPTEDERAELSRQLYKDLSDVLQKYDMTAAVVGVAFPHGGVDAIEATNEGIGKCQNVLFTILYAGANEEDLHICPKHGVPHITEQTEVKKIVLAAATITSLFNIYSHVREEALEKFETLGPSLGIIARKLGIYPDSAYPPEVN